MLYHWDTKTCDIKLSKWYRALLAHNPNRNGRKKERVTRNHNLNKRIMKEERLYFPKPRINERKEEYYQ